MMAFHVESEGKQLMVTADVANHYVLSLQRPDWEVSFDMNKKKAAKARKEIFGMLAADKVAFTGSHLPFPTVGYVAPMGSGFPYVAAGYQPDTASPDRGTDPGQRGGVAAPRPGAA